MRYIPARHLKPGQILAHDLLLSKKLIMLRRGKTLTQSLINRINQLGYQGVYVDDEISAGLYIKDVISPELRMRAKSEVETLLDSAEKNAVSTFRKHLGSAKNQIQHIVDEILRNRYVMVNIIDIRTYDDYTYSHSLNVAILSTVIGTVLGLSKTLLCELAMGALLHDTGKIFIDKRILNKPGKLTDEEFREMKKHSELGYRFLIKNTKISESALETALSHHESYDGGGYPKGLSGDNISLFGRIACVADVYDALTSDRPYRKAMLPSDAIEYIMSEYNTKFDPEIVNALMKKIAPYPIGTCVKLSSEDTAIVVKNNEGASLRPVVKLISKHKAPETYIDLANDREALQVTITDIVNY